MEKKWPGANTLKIYAALQSTNKNNNFLSSAIPAPGLTFSLLWYKFSLATPEPTPNRDNLAQERSSSRPEAT